MGRIDKPTKRTRKKTGVKNQFGEFLMSSENTISI